jgi:disulfide bond formation protein DsbB
MLQAAYEIGVESWRYFIEKGETVDICYGEFISCMELDILKEFIKNGFDPTGRFEYLKGPYFLPFEMILWTMLLNIAIQIYL